MIRWAWKLSLIRMQRRYIQLKSSMNSYWITGFSLLLKGYIYSNHVDKVVQFFFRMLGNTENLCKILILTGKKTISHLNVKPILFSFLKSMKYQDFKSILAKSLHTNHNHKETLEFWKQLFRIKMCYYWGDYIIRNSHKDHCLLGPGFRELCQ